jgi:hypothetical protein
VKALLTYPCSLGLQGLPVLSGQGLHLLKGVSRSVNTKTSRRLFFLDERSCVPVEQLVSVICLLRVSGILRIERSCRWRQIGTFLCGGVLISSDFRQFLEGVVAPFIPSSRIWNAGWVERSLEVEQPRFTK